MIKFVFITLIGLLLIVILKQYRPEYSYLTRLSVITVIMFSLIMSGNSIISSLDDLTGLTSMQSEYLKIMVKVLGISVITQMAGDTCRDSGETALASQLEFGARLVIIALSFPLIKKLIELSVALMS